MDLVKLWEATRVCLASVLLTSISVMIFLLIQRVLEVTR